MEGYDRSGLTRVLKAHIARYPLMDVQDAVKLMYQHEMGCEHMFIDRRAAEARLIAELASLEPAHVPLLEDLGGGWARLDLKRAKADAMPAGEILRLFCQSAGCSRGSKERLSASLELLRGEVVIASPSVDIEAFIAEYRAAGCPPVHHSERYRGAYRPAYRVIKASLLGRETGK